MPAFNKNRAYQLKQIIRRLSNRIINAHRVELTSDEMFELYTKEEDREILTKVFTLVAMGSDQRSWSHAYHLEKGSVVLNIFIDHSQGDKKWLVPRYAKQGPADGANANLELRAKLDRWVKKRVQLGLECAMVDAVFDELNWRCSAAAMAFFMPSIGALLDMVEDDPRAVAQREKLDTSRVPLLPSLPLGMDEAVLDKVSATVARGRLMDKKSEDKPETKVRFTISSPSKGLGETPWGTSLTIV